MECFCYWDSELSTSVNGERGYENKRMCLTGAMFSLAEFASFLCNSSSIFFLEMLGIDELWLWFLCS